MFIVKFFLEAIARVIDLGLNFFMLMVVARALITWVSPDPYNPIVQFLYRMTEPALRPIRRRLPVTGIDISPLILILGLVFLETFVVSSLHALARQL